jgi:hypothetical protein
MPTPWIDTIRRSGQLSVSFNSAISGSVWSGVAQRAVREFNRLSRRHRLGVRLTVVSQGAANIIVNIANGSASFTVDGKSHSVSVPGKSLQGDTSLLSRSGALFKSYVFLPSGPQVNHPSGPRLVGDGVKLVIAVHEFIHCCGLDNSDHSSDDIFTGNPSVDYGPTPNRDVVEIRAAKQRKRTAPPLFLRATTVSRVRRLWPTQRKSKTRRKRHGSVQRSGVRGAVSKPEWRSTRWRPPARPCGYGMRPRQRLSLAGPKS